MMNNKLIEQVIINLLKKSKALKDQSKHESMNDNHTVQLEGLLSMTKKKVEYFQETCDKLKEKMQKSLIATQLKQSYS